MSLAHASNETELTCYSCSYNGVGNDTCVTEPWNVTTANTVVCNTTANLVCRVQRNYIGGRATIYIQFKMSLFKICFYIFEI